MIELDTFEVRYELGGQVALPHITFALMRDKSTHFLMLTYLSLAGAATLRSPLTLASHVATETGLSEWYVKRAIRLLTKLGLIRVNGKVVEIVEVFHEKTVKALLGLKTGTVRVDTRAGEITHIVSKRTLDLTNVRPTVEAQLFAPANAQLAPANSVGCSQLGLLQPTIGYSQLDEKSVSDEAAVVLPITPDRKVDVESGGAIFPEDISIVTSTSDIVTNTPSINTNTKRSAGKIGKGRPTFVWTVGEEPDVDEVWTFWRDTLYPKRQTPNADDFSRIRCRLRDGATVEEMKAVVLHAKNDPWLNGTDPKNLRGKRYDSIEVLFNSHSKFEKYRDDAESSKTAIRRDPKGLDMRLSANNPEPTTGVIF